MFDFPPSPALGEEYVSGGVTYFWNGYGWAAKAGDPSASFVDVAGDTMTGDLKITKAADDPIGPNIFGQRDAIDRWCVQLAGTPAADFYVTYYNDAGVAQGHALVGNRVTGLLSVKGDPTVPLGIATKQYVDSNAGSGGLDQATADARYVNVAGDMMSGNLTISTATASPALTLNGIPGTGPQIFARINNVARWQLMLGDGGAESGANAGSDIALGGFDDAGALINYPLRIKRSSGLATVVGNPIVPLGIATKQYVDGAVGAGFLPLTGGTLSGDLTIQKASPSLRLIASASGQGMSIIGMSEALAQRWNMELGSNDAESGGATGAGGRSFILHAYKNDGNYIGQALNINRETRAAMFSGEITIAKPQSILWLNGQSGNARAVVGQSNGVFRWSMNLGDSQAESTSNKGSNFNLIRFDDAGNAIDSPILIWRETGIIESRGQQIAPATIDMSSNILINGGFDMNQFVGTGGISVGGGNLYTYFADGWRINKAGVSAFALQTKALGQVPEFRYGFCLIGITVAQPSMGGDYVLIEQPIEGARIARARQGTANATPISFCFRGCFPQAGPILMRLVSGDNSAVTDVTLNVTTANVPQWFTGTFAPCTIGVWPTDDTKGATLVIYLALSGSHINCVADVSYQTVISGVMLVPGNIPPMYTHLLVRPWSEEWQLCKRYYEKCGSGWTGAWSGGTTAQVFGSFEVQKRVAPTLFLSSSDNVYMELSNIGGSVTPPGVATIVNSQISRLGARVSFGNLVNSSAPSQGPAGLSSDPMCFDARLQ
jgi:hypothetical protein